MPETSEKTTSLVCPICGAQILPNNPFKPFCSKRHQDVDLNRWLSGVYRIETEEAPDSDAPVTGQENKDNS